MDLPFPTFTVEDNDMEKFVANQGPGGPGRFALIRREWRANPPCPSSEANAAVTIRV